MITVDIEQPFSFCYAAERMKWRNVAKIDMPLPEKPSDPIEIALLAAELTPETPKIDLHQKNVSDALIEVDAFLNHEFVDRPRNEIKVVKIIHGRGEGILRERIAQYLSGSKLVDKFRTSQDPSQANAVTLVVLAPNKKMI